MTDRIFRFSHDQRSFHAIFDFLEGYVVSLKLKKSAENVRFSTDFFILLAFNNYRELQLIIGFYFSIFVMIQTCIRFGRTFKSLSRIFRFML